MAKITPKKQGERETIVVKTKADGKPKNAPSDWWNSGSKKELTEKLLGTVGFLKEQNAYRFKQAALYARLYGNMPLFGVGGTNLTKLSNVNSLPADRPTMSIITSGVDTIVSRLTQSKPRPIFLTDNSNYKERSLAKQLNGFISGEFYQTKAYELGALALRDSCVIGDGLIKTVRTSDQRVGLERRLATEILVDSNDSIYGDPRQLFEIKLIDRSVLLEQFGDAGSAIRNAEQAYPDQAGESTKTVSDQVMVAEAWRLPSGPDAGDGLHVIVCSSGVILEREWKRKKFPFTQLQYSPRLLGLWSQGLAERQMGTQMGINQLLMTIHQSINLVGVPRVFVEKGSKVVKAHLNNQVGAIVEYSGNKPEYVVAPCVPVELYTQLERLIQFGYQQEGISQLTANAQKPAGLNSGEAIRNYDDIQSDRFAALERRYRDFYVDLAYQIMDEAIEIAEETGSYQTVFPDKDGTREIKLPEIGKLKENPFVLQAYDSSSLPRDPAGRLQKVTEMMQAGIVTPQEGRRLLDFPDIEQVDKLENAGEERILKILDDIVENGKFTPPDPFMDLQLATKLATQYYNLYMAAKLEESKAEMLRNFFTQVLALQKQAQAALAPPPGMPAPQGGAQPMANPTATPTSELLPNVPGVA